METSDEVYVWGSDAWGQLGLGSLQAQSFSLPQVCSYGVRVLQVACGEQHALLLTPDSAVYAFGSNADGRLGLGDRSLPLCSLPTLIQGLVSTPILCISCGAAHSAAVTASGDLYTWGQGSSGALGTGGSLSHWTPQQVSFPSGCSVLAVFCGGRHTAMVVKEASRKWVYMCGANENGQLGIGHQDSELVPKRVTVEGESSAVAAGLAHTLFLTTAGSVYSTGCNTSGQLGLGTRKSVKRPTLIPSITGVVHIAAGTQSAAVTRDFRLYLWGSGVFGEYLTPQRLKCAVEAQTVSLGSGFGAVLDSLGHVWTWGSNAGGELGHGDASIRLVPCPVLALQDRTVRLLACGFGFAIAVGESSGKKLRVEAARRREGRTRSALPAEVRTEEGLLEQALQDWRFQASEAQTALVRQQRDFAWRSQAALLEVQRLSERAGRADLLEIQVKEAEFALKSAQIQLKNAANSAEITQSEAYRKVERLEMELKAAQSDINRLESELGATLRAKAETQKQLERTSNAGEAALQALNSRQSELESNSLLQSHSTSLQIHSLAQEITQLRSNLQRSTAARETAHSKAEQLRGKVVALERAVEERERGIGELRRTVETQESRNRQLVEGLEGEVRQKAGAFGRAKAGLSVSPDSSLDHTLPSSESFSHSKSLLEARMDALEQKLSTLHGSQALF